MALMVQKSRLHARSLDWITILVTNMADSKESSVTSTKAESSARELDEPEETSNNSANEKNVTSTKVESAAMKLDKSEETRNNTVNDEAELMSYETDSKDSSSSNSIPNKPLSYDEEGIKNKIVEPKPPVTVKFDSPEESSDNSANEETEKLAVEKDSDNSSSSNNLLNFWEPRNDSKNRILAASKFSFVLTPDFITNKPKNSLLRPSQLKGVTNSSGATNKSVLQPPKFQNPFSKVHENDNNLPSSSTDNKNTLLNKNDNYRKNLGNDSKKEETDKELPTFLALDKTTKETDNSMSSSVAASASTPSFVFGQNLKERVTVAHDTDSSDTSEKEEVNEEASNTNGSSELMFTNAAANCKSTTKPGLTLTQAAQEMEEANRANKRKYNEVTLLTGEEDETNVLQISCKLFAFDKATSSWQERGRGSLRLNDKDDESRLVVRTAGTQRLVLNTKVWPGMTAERAGPKSLRLTAMDVQGDIRIFVVQAAQKEVEQLHNLLMQRLRRAQERQPKKLASEH